MHNFVTLKNFMKNNMDLTLIPTRQTSIAIHGAEQFES